MGLKVCWVSGLELKVRQLWGSKLRNVMYEPEVNGLITTGFRVGRVYGNRTCIFKPSHSYGIAKL